jgi:DNA-binding protein H-NS
MNLQKAVQTTINMINEGQKRGVWTLEEAATLNSVIQFFVNNPIMVVPPNMLAQLQRQQMQQQAGPAQQVQRLAQQIQQVQQKLPTIQEEAKTASSTSNEEVTLRSERVAPTDGPQGAETVAPAPVGPLGAETVTQ